MDVGAGLFLMLIGVLCWGFGLMLINPRESWGEAIIAGMLGTIGTFAFAYGIGALIGL